MLRAAHWASALDLLHGFVTSPSETGQASLSLPPANLRCASAYRGVSYTNSARNTRRPSTMTDTLPTSAPLSSLRRLCAKRRLLKALGPPADQGIMWSSVGASCPRPRSERPAPQMAHRPFCRLCSSRRFFSAFQTLDMIYLAGVYALRRRAASRIGRLASVGT
jgi:hypothetical protein